MLNEQSVVDASVSAMEGESATDDARKSAAVDAAVDQVTQAIARMGEGSPEGEGQPEGEAIPPMAYITLPASTISAALVCASTDPTRPECQGVHVRRDGLDVQVLATDGRMLFVQNIRPAGGVVLPAWLDQGVTIPRDGLAKRVSVIQSMVERDEIAPVRVGWSAGHYRVELCDVDDSIIFRMLVPEGVFPNLSPILGQLGALGERTFGPAEATLYNPAMLKGACAVSAALRGGAVALYEAGTDGGVSVVTFQSAPGAALIMMPLSGRAAMPEETIRALAPSMKGTLAALKANLTRSQTWLADCTDPTERARLESKISGLELRIHAIMVGINEAPELPAPAETEGVATESPAAKPAKAGKAKASKGKKPAEAEAGHPVTAD